MLVYQRVNGDLTILLVIQWDNNGVFCWDTFERGGCNGNRMEYQWEMNEISIGGKKEM
jgi:hypothetical protein